jgi:hypothetical protein
LLVYTKAIFISLLIHCQAVLLIIELELLKIEVLKYPTISVKLCIILSILSVSFFFPILNGKAVHYILGSNVDNFFGIFIHLFIYAYIVWAISPPWPLPSPQPPLLPGRTCSALFSDFVEEKT